MNVQRRVTHAPGRLVRHLGACALIASSLAATAQPARVQSQVGKRAPAFTRRDLAGQIINLNSFRDKVVLLNFWATWCAPCQTEMPVFSAWQREYGSQGFQVIGISMDDDAGAARKLVEELKIAYPVAMGDARLGEQYGGVLGLPLTFLIGRDGKVLAQFQGETDLKTMQAQMSRALRVR
jgi:peroxiredoxin